MTPNAQFQRLQNRVAAAFLAALPEHKSVFSGDWGSASTSRNQVFPKHRECLVFAFVYTDALLATIVSLRKTGGEKLA